MYLLSDAVYLWLPYYFWILFWITGFNENSKIHLGKTQLFWFVFVYIFYRDTCAYAIFSYGDDILAIINY